MLCQKCGLREATVHLESKVFRQKIEEHLCALCAGPRKSEAVNLGSEKTLASAIQEIELTARIDPHDYQAKLRYAAEFLRHGSSVKLRLKFRGRELAQTEIGFDVIKRAITDLAGIGSPCGEPKLMGRNIHVLVTPLPLAPGAC
jgi:hypothetical protein